MKWDVLLAKLFQCWRCPGTDRRSRNRAERRETRPCNPGTTDRAVGRSGRSAIASRPAMSSFIDFGALKKRASCCRYRCRSAAAACLCACRREVRRETGNHARECCGGRGAYDVFDPLAIDVDGPIVAQRIQFPHPFGASPPSRRPCAPVLPRCPAPCLPSGASPCRYPSMIELLSVFRLPATIRPPPRVGKGEQGTPTGRVRRSSRRFARKYE